MPDRSSSSHDFFDQRRARRAMQLLDVRERAILVELYEHKVLLTEQIRVLFFHSLRRAQDRLNHLAHLGLIKSWCPLQPGRGKAPGHHRLTESGVHVVAAMKGVAPSALKYTTRNEDGSEDSYLPHRLGVNAFFCALVQASLANRGHGLAEWKPERTVRVLDQWVRPDGYGRYLHPGGCCDFYFEYDRATEHARQLSGKLAGYIGLARDWTERGPEHFPNVIILCPDLRRERAIARAFSDARARFKAVRKLRSLPFFVASEDALHERGVLGRIWAPLPGMRERLSIVELSCQSGLEVRPSQCLGHRFRDRTEGRGEGLGPSTRPPRFPVGKPPDDRRPGRGRP